MFAGSSGCATWSWEDAINVGSNAVCAWMRLVTFDLAATAGDTGSRIEDATVGVDYRSDSLGCGVRVLGRRGSGVG